MSPQEYICFDDLKSLSFSIFERKISNGSPHKGIERFKTVHNPSVLSYYFKGSFSQGIYRRQFYTKRSIDTRTKGRVRRMEYVPTRIQRKRLCLDPRTSFRFRKVLSSCYRVAERSCGDSEEDSHTQPQCVLDTIKS